jgi:IS30 family transposase
LKVTSSMRRQIVELRAGGFTIRAIALFMNLANSTIDRVLNGQPAKKNYSRKGQKKKVLCLKCDRPFASELNRRGAPIFRLCPACKAVNREINAI